MRERVQKVEGFRLGRHDKHLADLITEKEVNDHLWLMTMFFRRKILNLTRRGFVNYLRL